MITEEKRALDYVPGDFEGLQEHYGNVMRQTYATLRDEDKDKLKRRLDDNPIIDLDALMAHASQPIPSVVIERISGNLGASLVHMHVPEGDRSYWAQRAADGRGFAPGNAGLTTLCIVYLAALKENDAEIARRQQALSA